MLTLRAVFYALLSIATGAGATAPPSKPAELHYLRGLLAEHSGALAQAQEELDLALKEDGASPYLAREAAEVALELGDADKALRFAKVVETAKPDDPDAHILMGRVLWARGQTDDAQASFEKALDLDPQSVESVLSLATLLGPRAPEKAKKLLSEFLEKDPDHAAEAYLQIAKIDMQQNQPADARKSLRKAIEIEPDESSLPARYALAQAYEVDHSTEDALKEYLAIANLEPDNVSLLDHIGELYLEQDNDAGAKASFEQAKRVQAADPASNRWLAAIAEKNNDFAQAAAFLRASAALPEEPTLNLQLSYYLTQAGHLKEAVDVLEKAHARWPSNDQVAYFLALGYDDLKDEAKALALLRKVVAVKPDYHEARFQLGVILEKLDKMDEAETQFRALLADTPEDAAVLNYLGYSLADRGLKLGEAEGYVKKAVSLDPRNGAYQDSLGWVHFKQGRVQDALAELINAAKTLPEDDTVWEHVGDAQAASGDMRSAWLSWRRSQALASGPSTAARKAVKAQRKFKPEELGALYQDFFSYGQGGIEKLDGLCRLSGAVLGHAFSFQAMVHSRKRDFSIEVLGPLFSPVARMSVGPSGFAMEGLRIPGVPQGDVDQAAGQALALLRDYMSGGVFRLSPARWHRTFWRRRQSVRADELKIALDSSAALAARLLPEKGAVRALDLAEFGREQGHLLPKTLTVDGRGFKFSIDFTDVKAALAPLPIPIPR